MRITTNIFLRAIILSVSFLSATAAFAQGESTREERNYIKEGNKLYNEGRYRAAMVRYQDALRMNPSSAAGRYNLGLSQLRLGTNEADTTQAAKDMLKKGTETMEQIAKMGAQKPMLASKANFNLGNVAFKAEDYASAINSYKQALRLNPDDAAAKRNLRIAQLKKQDQDQNQDQDKDDQDQNKDQNQDQEQDKQDKQQNQQDQQQQQPQQNPQQQQDLNQQTADQILQAMENKENQTRARVGTGNQGDKSTGRNRNRRNW